MSEVYARTVHAPATPRVAMKDAPVVPEMPPAAIAAAAAPAPAVTAEPVVPEAHEVGTYRKHNETNSPPPFFTTITADDQPVAQLHSRADNGGRHG